MSRAIEREVSDEAIRQYLDGIGHYDLLTAEEEVQLARAIEAGRKAEVALENETDPTKRRKLNHLVRAGEEARQTFIRANLRLVVSIAKRYGNSRLPFLDLDRKSTRLNSSHVKNSYAVFCLKKKKINANLIKDPKSPRMNS